MRAETRGVGRAGGWGWHVRFNPDRYCFRGMHGRAYPVRATEKAGVGEDTAFLGVERSASGRRWRLRHAGDDGAAAAIATQLAVPEILARLLSQRGVGLDEAAQFVSPRLRDQLPDPAHLKDMDRAVERLVRAIRDHEKIVVFGDYDVDGAT